MMKRNVGDLDRLIRAILGVYAMLLGFLFIQHLVGTILGIIGLIALATAITGRCVLYTLWGKSTVKKANGETGEEQAEA